jgi:hypothetical protein
MKPPTMTLAPAGIIATASSTDTGFMWNSDQVVPRMLEGGGANSFDLGQGFTSLALRNDADALQYLASQLADLGVAPFERGLHCLANRHEAFVLREHELCLQQLAAFH